MAQLTDLSGELLLSVASFVTQTDLLNASLTCRRLQVATEPELFREYINRHSRRRSFLTFIRLLLERPELARHVHRLELGGWHTLEALDPFWASELDVQCLRQPNEIEYMLVAGTAQALGVIDFIAPYEPGCPLRSKVSAMRNARADSRPRPWFTHIFDSEVATAQVPYSQKFCMLLRAGLEDPLIAILIHMLPNIREIFIHDIPCDGNTLPWNLPRHRFDHLRQFSVRSMGGDTCWPITFFGVVLQGKKLDTLRVSSAGGFWRGDVFGDVVHIPNPPTLKPGSLNLRHIDLHYCTFSKDVMRTLLEASPQMIRFYYTTGHLTNCEDVVKPAELIGLLKPFEHSLEHLSIDICPYPHWNFIEGEHIESMRHFSKLKYLDTRPEMWRRMDKEDVADNPLEEVELLHSRLPPSLMHLIFHDRPLYESKESTEISYEQIRRLLPHRRALLPNLKSITMVVRSRQVVRRFERLLSADRIVDLSADKIVDGNQEQRKPFKFYIHLRKERRFFTTTIFHYIPDHADLTLKRWSGTAYADVKWEPLSSQEPFDWIVADNAGTIPDDLNGEDLRGRLKTTDEPADNASAGDPVGGENDDDWEDCESEDW